jgi:hypothetical protein
MAEFGWAFINCEDPGVANGPTGSLQFHSGSNDLSGSDNLVWLTSSNTLNLTGTLNVSGTINANEINIDVENRTVINIDVSGSTKFGDTSDDTHQFTGSVYINGGLSLQGGGIAFAYTRITATPYTASTANYIIGVSASGHLEIELPRAQDVPAGTVFYIKDEWDFTGSGRDPAVSIDINMSGSDLIDGETNYQIENGDFAAVSLYSDGASNWFII